MSNFTELNRKYVVCVTEHDGKKNFYLWPKVRKRYTPNGKEITVSKAFNLAKESNDSVYFEPFIDRLEWYCIYDYLYNDPVECFLTAKKLNDQLGVNSGFFTEYIFARENNHITAFTKKDFDKANKSISETDIKKLNIFWGFEKFNQEENLFCDDTYVTMPLIEEKSDNPADDLFEYSYQYILQKYYSLRAPSDTDGGNQIYSFFIRDKLAARIKIDLDENEKTYSILDIDFINPELNPNAKHTEYYKFAAQKYMAENVLDYLVNADRCFNGKYKLNSISYHLAGDWAKNSSDKNYQLIYERTLAIVKWFEEKEDSVITNNMGRTTEKPKYIHHGIVHCNEDQDFKVTLTVEPTDIKLRGAALFYLDYRRGGFKRIGEKR